LKKANLLSLKHCPLVDEPGVAGLADTNAVLAILFEVRQFFRLWQVGEERKEWEATLG
jgi:hypothetical protein